jgi:4-hydroxybenzoate polyprenyltransferase
MPLLAAMRPRQWPKNGFVFVALLFDGIITSQRVAQTVAAFVLLCLMSGAVYIMNDLSDVESDRHHPKKRHRPIASGALAVPTARAASALLAVGSVIAGYLLAPAFAAILLLYLLTQIAYTFWLKHVVLLDVATIATGFILRIAAGVTVIEVQRFSPWLYLFGGFLSLFMVLGKRRHEISSLGELADSHRAILAEYTVDFLDKLIGIVTTSAIVFYSLYTFLAEGLPENDLMMLSVPFLIYGLFRYLYLIHIRGEGGAPEEILLRDRPMQITLAFWLLVVILALYLLK